MVNPRRGKQDKSPWRDLNLTEITGQTIEAAHLYDVHLGETLVPYATLEPLKAVLPLKREDKTQAKDSSAVSGVKLEGMENRMRDRWRKVSRLWDANKLAANNLSLLQRLDYHGELTAQIKWQHDDGGMPVRVLYGASGAPTAAIVTDSDAIIDYTGFWFACVNRQRPTTLSQSSTPTFSTLQSNH